MCENNSRRVYIGYDVYSFFVYRSVSSEAGSTPVGASPTRVIASEPYSQTGWVAVMEGAKGVGKIVTCVIVRQHGMYFAHSLFGEVYFIIDFISSK